MFARIGRHVRQQYAGFLALFIALGGVSYAAVTLPKNSVGSKQIERGAVKTADLANDAVTTGKVKDGSLLSGDFAPGQLVAGSRGETGPQGPKGETGDRGPSAAFSVFRNGRAVISGTGTTVATLPNLAAGRYVVNAKAWVETSSASARVVTCVLAANSDTDTTLTQLEPESGVVTRAAIALQVVHSDSGTFNITLRCSNDGPAGNVIGVNDIKITAIQVGSLANNPAS